MVFEKKCIGPCGRVLPLSEFHKRPDSPDGHRNNCKQCGRERMKIHDAKPESRERQRQRRNGTAEPLWSAEPVLEKVCFRCGGDPQPIENFGEAKQNKDGYKGVCKSCRHEADQSSYAANRDESLKVSRAYYKANKERLDKINRQNAIKNREKYRPVKQRAQNRRYREDPSKVLASAKRRHAALRIEILTALGGHCTCCGETDFRLLTIDHKSKDGAAHRREIGGSQSANANVVLRWIKKNMDGAKQTIQILCWNCNNGSWKNGICPHQEFNIVTMALDQRQALAA